MLFYYEDFFRLINAKFFVLIRFRFLPFLIFSLFLNIFSLIQFLEAASLNGTATLVYKNQHHVFSNNEIARGLVRMGGGFTVKSGATATLDTVISVSGGIDLRDTGILQLISDLYLDSRVTISGSGYINGLKKTIFLSDNLTIPSSKILVFVGNTIIDGQGKTIDMGNYAQFLVESNITLTLRNMIIKSSKSNIYNPFLRVANYTGALALDNVTISLPNDIVFAQGKMYIHRDVTFTGTSAFIYTSVAPLVVTPSSRLKFDIGTTFSFIPSSSNKDLLVLSDRTSTLHLNGSTFKTTSTGCRLTKGRFVLENKVTLDSNSSGGIVLSTLSTNTSAKYGTILRPHCIAWHPNGNIVAIGGWGAISGVGGFATTDQIRLYRYNGSTLTPLTSRQYNTSATSTTGVYNLHWNPAGTVLAVSGSAPTNGGTTGFANTNEVRLYSFDGSTLTALTSVAYGGGTATTIVQVARWDPSGTVLAVGGQGATAVGGFAANQELRLYSFNGSTLTALVGDQYNGNVWTVTWSKTGQYLAIGGNTSGTTGGLFGTNSNELRIYSFNGSALAAVTSQNWTTGTNYIRHVEWNYNDSILIASGQSPTSGTGGFANTDMIRIYGFNGSSLSPITSIGYGAVNDGNARQTIFHPSGTVIAVVGDNPQTGYGGFSNLDELRMYSFDGTTATPLDSKDYTTIYSGPTGPGVASARAIAWNPSGTALAIGGTLATNGSGGFNNTDEFRIYTPNFVAQETSPQAPSNSIIFGNSALGSSYDLNVEIFGGATVNINGIVNDDSA